VRVAQGCGAAAAYLPGLAMDRIADLHPGEAKTDARDAAVIADAARTLPHTLHEVEHDDETLAAPGMLNGFDDDLATESTRVANRIHGLLTQIHPGLERAVGAHLGHPAVTGLLQKYPTPAAIPRAGKSRVTSFLRKTSRRSGPARAGSISEAVDGQTVVVVGTETGGLVLPRLAAQLEQLQAQWKETAAEIGKLVEDHPLPTVLTSLPGVGTRTAGIALAEVCGTTFPTSAHLASYAGIAPVTRRSGTSSRGEHRSKGGNKKLKRALYLAAFASLRNPDVLRPQTRRGNTPPPGRHGPQTQAPQRPVCHAQRRGPIESSSCRSNGSWECGRFVVGPAG
jgi:transposase